MLLILTLHAGVDRFYVAALVRGCHSTAHDAAWMVWTAAQLGRSLNFMMGAFYQLICTALVD